MSENDIPLVAAIVFLKSPSGLSLANESKPITSQNIKQYRPDMETIAKAVHSLQELGFVVPEANQPDSKIITLTVTGRPELFEKVFNVKLTVVKRTPTVDSPGGIWARSSEKLRIPDSLKDTVDDIRFEEPVELFKESVKKSARIQRKRPKIRRRKEVLFKM